VDLFKDFMQEPLVRLETITLKNWKGQNVRHALSPLCLISGPNGAGKSAILEGIQFACEGRSPLGDSPQAALPLVGLTGGGVHVALDNGFGWSRELAIDHSEGGKVSQTLAIDGRGIGKVKETEGAIKERIGRNGEIFSPMFRLDNFLDLSDDKRRDFVLELCATAQRTSGGGACGGTPAAPQLLNRIHLAYLTEALGEGTVATNKDRENAADFLVDKLSEGERQAFGEIMVEVSAALRGDIADCLNAALAAAKDGIQAARRAKDDANSAVRQISERLAAVTVSAETATALRERLAKVREERSELEKQIARQEAVVATRTGLARRLDQMRTDAAQQDAAIKAGPLTDTYADPAALEAEADELATPYTPTDLKELEATENQARIELGEAAQTWSDLMNAVGKAKNEAERLQVVLKVAEKDDWTALDALCDAHEGFFVDVQEGALTSWAAIRTFVQSRKLHENLDAVRASLDEATAKFNLANNEYEAASAIHDAAKAALHAATTALREARSRVNDETREAAERTKKANSLREQARSIRNSVERAAQADANRAERLQKLQSDIVTAEAELNRFDAELGGFVPMAELEMLRTALVASAEALETSIKAKDGNDRLKEEYTKCVADAEAQAIKWEVCKKLAEGVKKLREEIMVELVAPLLTKMDEFFAASGAELKAYCGLIDARGSRVFDLGIQRGDERIVYAALSGGERCLVGAALAYALVQLADPPLKLLMIEAAECDTYSLHAIADACYQLSSNLSNVLLATWINGRVPGWEHLELYIDEQEAVSA
jgi:DNA repair exonuclease SbcCD ATPase subunit